MLRKRKVVIGVAGGIALLTGLVVGAWVMRDRDAYIAAFPGDKAAAVSFTFDDGCPSTFTSIVPILDGYHRKATFFVIPSINFAGDGWQRWKVLSDSGYEIGSHTLTHPDLTKVDTAQVRYEVREASAMIQKYIGQKPVSFAHPHHHTTSEVDDVVFNYHAFARCSPKGFCDWHGWVSATTEQEIKDKIDRAIHHSEWYVAAAHGLGDGWEPVSESLLRHTLDYVREHDDQIIVDTFGHIGQYRLEREHTRVTTVRSGDHLTISLVCDLPPSSCTVPLTIVVKKDATWSDLKITSAEGPVTYIARQADILVYAMPHATLELSWSLAPARL